MLRRPVILTVESLSRMITTQNLGRPHLVFAPGAVWADPTSDRDNANRMWQEFSVAGLTDRRGQLDGDVLDTLAILGRPSVEYFALFSDHEQQRAALVAGGVSESVVVYRIGSRAEVSSIDTGSLPAVLMRQLPDRPAARIDSLNARTDALRAQRGDAPPGWLEPATSAETQDARTLATLARKRVLGQGELYVGVRDQLGRRRLSDQPLRYQDLRIGRIMITLSGEYVSVVGATKRMLAGRVEQVHRNLVTGRC